MDFEVLFYCDLNGHCDIEDYLDELHSDNSKSARIIRVKILTYIRILSILGVSAGAPYVKHIKDDIWELRPGNNRILFFYFSNSRYILLHHFVKTTTKTPIREIERAVRERDDYVRRFENENNSKL